MRPLSALLTPPLQAPVAGLFPESGAPPGSRFDTRNPANGEVLASIASASDAAYQQVMQQASAAFLAWREVPAPQRGALVRQIGQRLRQHKAALGRLVSLETGKILSEGEGEVQEMIDMADFATGLSRMIGGRTLPSERPEHRMLEQWHPLGVVGVITAFNFPVAVWAWNAMIALICGNSVVWKPSPKGALCALAVQTLVQECLDDAGLPPVASLVCDADGRHARKLAADPRVALLSFTGSSHIGRDMAVTVARRMGRHLLECSGNNGVIVCADADLDLALRAVVFGAVGTTGQRCTTTRRLFVASGQYDSFVSRLCDAYRQIPVGDPLLAGTLMGPLIDDGAVGRFLDAIKQAQSLGGEVLCGGHRLDRPGHFVEPTVVCNLPPDAPLVQEETFGPLLYVFPFDTLDEVIAWHNAVPQGLSSALFTRDMATAERFLATSGSDCGIANINLGTSGAEIGGAFGGEKTTGGGREAGSDAWKSYMRRQTCTINHGSTLPLAQGICFNLP